MLTFFKILTILGMLGVFVTLTRFTRPVNAQDAEVVDMPSILETASKNHCVIQLVGGGGERIYLAPALYYGSKTEPDKIYYLSDRAPHFTLKEFQNLECFPTPKEAEAAGYVLVPKNYTPPSPPPKDEIDWETAGFGLGFAGVFFIYFALALRALAKKYNTPRSWRAWIPFMNWSLLVDIAKKPRWWAWYILAPLFFLIALGVLAPLPEPWAVIFGLAMAGSFFLEQLLVALCVIAIAKNQGRAFAIWYGLLMGFGQPIGAIMFGLLAWGKAASSMSPPHSNWRDPFRFS